MENKVENGLQHQVEAKKNCFLCVAPMHEDNFWHFFLASLFGGKNVRRILKTRGIILDHIFARTFYTRFNTFWGPPEGGTRQPLLGFPPPLRGERCHGPMVEGVTHPTTILPPPRPYVEPLPPSLIPPGVFIGDCGGGDGRLADNEG